MSTHVTIVVSVFTKHASSRVSKRLRFVGVILVPSRVNFKCRTTPRLLRDLHTRLPNYMGVNYNHE